MEEQACAREMAQELVTQAGAFGRPFDQARNVGDNEAPALVHAHDTEVGLQRRERIVGYLGSCRRHRAYERRLARVGKAEQAYVREDFQLELQLAAFSRRAVRELPWRAVDTRFEVEITEAALTAFREQGACFVMRQVSHHGARLEIRNHRPDRHPQHDIGCGPAVAVGALAFLAVLRPVDARVAVVDERIQVAVGHDVDTAAAAAIAAVRPAARHELLPPEARDAVAALAGVHFDRCFVDELHAVRGTSVGGGACLRLGPCPNSPARSARGLVHLDGNTD